MASGISYASLRAAWVLHPTVKTVGFPPRPFSVKVDGVPLGVAVLATLCVYKALKDHEAGQRTEEQRNS